MSTPILRDLIGSVITVTAGNAVSTGNYSVSADKLVWDNTTNLALLADFELVLGGAFGVAPVTGGLFLYAVDYDLTGSNAGPAPTSTSPTPRYCGVFSPQPNSANTATTWKMKLNSIPLVQKTDYYILNTTGQSLVTGWILKGQSWSPGT
jgi:hypothetical protein